MQGTSAKTALSKISGVCLLLKIVSIVSCMPTIGLLLSVKLLTVVFISERTSPPYRLGRFMPSKIVLTDENLDLKIRSMSVELRQPNLQSLTRLPLPNGCIEKHKAPTIIVIRNFKGTRTSTNSTSSFAPKTWISSRMTTRFDSFQDSSTSLGRSQLLFTWSQQIFLNNWAFATTLHLPDASCWNVVDFFAAYNHNPRYFFGSLIVTPVTSEVKPLEKEMYET